MNREIESNRLKTAISSSVTPSLSWGSRSCRQSKSGLAGLVKRRADLESAVSPAELPHVTAFFVLLCAAVLAVLGCSRSVGPGALVVAQTPLASESFIPVHDVMDSRYPKVFWFEELKRLKFANFGWGCDSVVQ